MSTLISSLTWIPRGRAAQYPRKYDLNESEMERVGKMGGEGVLESLRKEMEKMEMQGQGGVRDDDDDEWEEESGSDDDHSDKENGDADETEKADAEDSGMQQEDEDEMAKYNMDTYDEEEPRALGAFTNIKGLTYYEGNKEDPYITLENDAQEEDEDREALEILPTDSLLLTARTSDDLSTLEYHVFDEPNENLYVHHDLLLPSMPLCVEWLDFPVGPSTSLEKTHGNYIAVGTYDPSIEIWDMDVIDGLYPDALLGASPSMEKPVAKPKGTGKKKKRIMEEPKSEEYHTSSITGLSWTPHHRNLLISSSADQTVKLWDLTRESPQSALKSWDQIHPGEKVLGIEWNKHSSADHSTVVLSAGERTVKVWDTRAAQDGLSTGSLGSDTECIRWDPWNAMSFYVSLENGLILSYDARMLSSSGTTPQPKYTISAHDGPVSALDINPHVRGCIATGSMDKQVKIWNVNEEDEGKREVSLVTSRDLGVGKVFSVRFSPDSPLTLAAAGSLAKVQIWDVASNAGARHVFGPRLRQAGKELAEARKNGNGVVGVADNDEDSDEED